MLFTKTQTKSQVVTKCKVTKLRIHCTFQKVSFVYHVIKYFELKLYMTVSIFSIEKWKTKWHILEINNLYIK